jgi:hypothetical protein
MPLSDADASFLGDGNLTFLFALRPDGSPTGWPMTSEFREGELTFSTYAKSLKARVCTQAGIAAALAVRRDAARVVRAVCAEGTVTVRTPEGGGPGVRSRDGLAALGAMEVPEDIRVRVESAEREGKRAVLALDVSAGAVWSLDARLEGGHAEA